MPMFKELALCPSAVVIPPDMAKYVRVGREVRHAMQTLTPLVEPLSIDEAFLDLSGTQRVHGMIPAKVLARFARDVERDIGITVSVGLSCNKFLAKIASDLDKPRGFAALDQDEAREMLADKPVSFIYGVGPATQEKLLQRGFRTIDLQRADGRADEAALPAKAEGYGGWRAASTTAASWPTAAPRPFPTRPRSRTTSGILQRWKRCCGGCPKKCRRG
jgi:nucleotidyltransferase/DNA polymerase involved in DNA repair